jgi:hypothetical protein
MHARTARHGSPVFFPFCRERLVQLSGIARANMPDLTKPTRPHSTQRKKTVAFFSVWESRTRTVFSSPSHSRHARTHRTKSKSLARCSHEATVCSRHDLAVRSGAFPEAIGAPGPGCWWRSSPSSPNRACGQGCRGAGRAASHRSFWVGLDCGWPGARERREGREHADKKTSDKSWNDQDADQDSGQSGMRTGLLLVVRDTAREADARGRPKARDRWRWRLSVLVRLINHQRAVLFSHNKLVTINQSAVLFS